MNNDFLNRLKIIKMNIAYYRKLKGLTQEGLAEKLDISRTHMSNLEALNMTTGITLEMLFNISDVLEIDVVKLIQTK